MSDKNKTPLPPPPPRLSREELKKPPPPPMPRSVNESMGKNKK